MDPVAFMAEIEGRRIRELGEEDGLARSPVKPQNPGAVAPSQVPESRCRVTDASAGPAGSREARVVPSLVISPTGQWR